MNQWHNQLASTISLDGIWEFALGDQHGELRVPGTWEAQDYARRVDGPALLRKSVYIPSEWRGQHIQLQFDALSYHVEARINDQLVGEHSGLWTPFAFDVTDVLRFGETNQIALTIYKPGEKYPMRESLAGFLPDVCLPFGGIWQSTRLVAFPAPAISDIWVLADAEKGEIHIQANLHHAEGLTRAIRILSPDGGEVARWHASYRTEGVDKFLTISDIQRWSPDHPVLYRAEITLEAEGQVQALVGRSFGFRTLSKQGEQLLFNDLPIFLRGILNWGWYPDILCPAPDEATIRDEFRRVREFGYNMVKLCLCVPSPLYFDIADQEGMLLWLELPMWLPQVTPRLREQVLIEYRDILASAHSHPSIILYSLGCELSHSVDANLLSRLNDLLRDRTMGVLACDNSGSGEAYGGLMSDFSDFNDYHFYSELHNFNPLVDHFRRDWHPPRPWIFGEFCDADDYRDLSEIAAAGDGKLPWWLTEKNPLHPTSFLAYHEQSERMAALDLDFDHQTLQRISRQQSFVVRKTILEKVRAHAGMGGYVVTGLRDNPIAPSAMFDDFNRPKYDADSFREFNAATLLLLEQGRKRAWSNGGDRPTPTDRFNHFSGAALDFRIVLSQSGADLPGGDLRWKLLAPDGQVQQASRNLVAGTPPSHRPIEITRLTFAAPQVETPLEFTLAVELEGQVRNHWSLWIYPLITEWPRGLAIYDPSGSLSGLDDLFSAAENITRQTDFHVPDGSILITSAFRPQVNTFIQSGGRAVIIQTGNGSLPVRPCPFWREGIKLLCDHAVLKAFPHQGYADLQFYHLATDYALDSSRIKAMIPDSDITPVMRRLDARQFTLSEYLVELQIGAGHALASTLHFAGDAGDQVIGLRANIAGRWLLHQMLLYLQSS